MFKIEAVKPSDSSLHGFCWINNHDDDFLQFVPEAISNNLDEELTKDDLTVYKVSTIDKESIQEKLDANESNELNLDLVGKVQVIDTANSNSIELDISLTALSQWPYDESGKFLGNN